MEKWLIGVISDTHGLVRPEVYTAFEGCDLILHAGDVGSGDVLDELRSMAPVVAVRGNTDRGIISSMLPFTEVVEIGEVFIYILHDLNDLDIEPKAAGFNIIISGHTHKPSYIQEDGIIYLNPGSAGPRRFDLPVTVALMEIYGKDISIDIIEIA